MEQTVKIAKERAQSEKVLGSSACTLSWNVLE